MAQDQAETLRELVRRESEHGKTRVITVTSGKGGVGKTNISTNLAIAYAERGKKVVVFDADLGLANVNVILNVVPKYNLYHVIRRQKTMEEILLKTQYGIYLVAGASGFSQIANLSADEREPFLKGLVSLSFADIIIIDTAAGINSSVVDFIDIADDILVITTPEPTAITDAYGMIKIIATEVQKERAQVQLIVNQVNSVSEGRGVAQRLANISTQFLNMKVDYLGFVFNDPLIQQAVRRQRPFYVMDPKAKVTACVRNIVSRLEREEARDNKGLSHLIRKWLNVEE